MVATAAVCTGSFPHWEYFPSTALDGTRAGEMYDLCETLDNETALGELLPPSGSLFFAKLLYMDCSCCGENVLLSNSMVKVDREQRYDITRTEVSPLYRGVGGAADVFLVNAQPAHRGYGL